MKATAPLRGNIQTPWAGRAKEYAWNKCVELAPRKITPMDVDYMVECNWRFMFFEMKTEGSEMPRGQKLALLRMLQLLSGRAVLVVAEHPPLARIRVSDGLTRFQLYSYGRDASGKARLSEAGPYSGGAFPAVYAAFFKWAEGDTSALRRALPSLTLAA